MNWSDDSNLALQRQGQRAKFQRWFGVGEFGHFYFDRAGRARRIEPGQMDGFIHQAIQISDAYFAKANNHGIIFGAGGVVLVMILSFWVPFIKDHQTKFLSAVAGLDLLYLIWQYFADYRKPLNALREELERTLAAAPPCPEEIVRPANIPDRLAGDAERQGAFGRAGFGSIPNIREIKCIKTRCLSVNSAPL